MYLQGSGFADLRFVVSKEEERGHRLAMTPDSVGADDRQALLQIGNNTHHEFVYERALKGGAIIEMHDLSLHHLHTEMTLGRGDFAAYRDVLEACEGEWGRRFAYQRSKGYYSPNLEFHTRVNRTITAKAEAVIVHSEWAKMQLELQGCDRPIYVVPHFAATPEQSAASCANRAEARRKLKLSEEAFVILAAGYVTRAKKVEWAIEAFEALATNDPNVLLVIAGACDFAPVAAQIEASPWRDRIRVTGYTTDAEFCDYTLAADILPVMRFPSAGESSGVAARALGFGRLVVVPELMAFSDLDDKICEKVELDRDPVDQLIAIFSRWRDDPDALRRRESEISAYAAAHLSLEDLRRDVAAILSWHWA
jgi:glycosyltransferase involved in cell wall biosynthesis